MTSFFLTGQSDALLPGEALKTHRSTALSVKAAARGNMKMEEQRRRRGGAEEEVEQESH